MGVYIPNMSKPKRCGECELWSNCFYPKNPYAEQDDYIADDCPLIEIDDEEMNGLINLYKMCKATSKVKSIQLKDIKLIGF